MPIRLSERATEAYAYPLLIKQLLHAPLATAADQEIVYRDRQHASRLDDFLQGLPARFVLVGDQHVHALQMLQRGYGFGVVAALEGCA